MRFSKIHFHHFSLQHLPGVPELVAPTERRKEGGIGSASLLDLHPEP